MIKNGVFEGTITFAGGAQKFGGDRDGRNAADIIAKWTSGAKWAIRVRKGGNGVAPDASFRPKIPGATAVIARLNRGEVEYFSARTGRKLTPPKSRAHAR